MSAESEFQVAQNTADFLCALNVQGETRVLLARYSGAPSDRTHRMGVFLLSESEPRSVIGSFSYEPGMYGTFYGEWTEGEVHLNHGEAPWKLRLYEFREAALEWVAGRIGVSVEDISLHKVHRGNEASYYGGRPPK